MNVENGTLSAPNIAVESAAGWLLHAADAIIDRLKANAGRPTGDADVMLLVDGALAASNWLSAIHRRGDVTTRRASAREEFVKSIDKVSWFSARGGRLGNPAESARIALRALKATLPTAEDLGNVARLIRIAIVESDQYVADLYRNGLEDRAEALAPLVDEAVSVAVECLGQIVCDGVKGV